MSTSLIAGTATDFDRLVVPCEVPIEIAGGQTAALQVADQVHRGVQIVGRFERSGLAGFKVAAAGRRLRVTVTLAVDAGSVRGWHEGEPDPAEAGKGLPRLIQVRSQGRLRQCVLLKAGSRIKRSVVVFDLLPEEMPDDGLICIEALDIMGGRGVSGALRDAVTGSVMEDGVAGLRIDSVAFAVSPAENQATAAARQTWNGAGSEDSSLISCGGLTGRRDRESRSLRSGLLIVNPTPPGVFGSGGALTIRLGSRAEATSGRRVRALIRKARPGANGWTFRAGAPAVQQVLSVQDGDLAPPIQSTSGNITELELPAPMDAPVLVVVTAKQGVVPTLLSTTWTP
ncbi:hypothetical protein ACGFNP_10945 [Nonomuraea sp. NPDC049269]|uniref:hypothetical protein n=1 Tax=Nonomuraea sp. NPDC049269 TaxID=3364349 RepID=UPI00371DE625